MNASKLAAVSLSAACAASLFSVAAQSQETQPATSDQSGALEEVTVTARRRAESVQDVPISIVSKSGDFLQQAHVQNVSELSRVVPGFVFNEFEAGQQSTAQLRGLSSYAVETHAPQSVGIVVDDVVLNVMGQSVSDFNDIERIEVLRGPQGTLFGRNTTGGVVHIVTKDPSDDFEAKVSGSYGSYDEVKWNGTVNVPLSDSLAARASVFTANRDGYIENINDGRMLSSEQQAGISSKFLYTPRAGTRLKLQLRYIERHQQGRADPVLAFGPLSTESDREVNAGLVGPENDKVNGVGFHPFDEKSGMASLTWNQDIGDFELTSISAFEYWWFHFGDGKPFHTFNAPVEPLSTVRFYVPNQLHGWSQEVRLTSPSGRRVEYVAGIFASGMNLFERRDFQFNLSEDPAEALYLFDLGDQNTEHRDYAVFGEADFHLTDTVTLTAGARWTHDQTHVDLTAKAPPADNYIGFLESEFPGFRELSTADNEWTWRGGIRWEPTSDLMFYGTAARGFKGPTITALGILGRIKPEIAQSYEVGTKLQFLNGRLTTNLAVYHSDVDNLQAQASSTLTTPRGPIDSIFLTNAAEVRSQGVELELSAAPTDQLTFDLGVAYTDAQFTKFPLASCYEGQLELGTGCTPGQPDPDNPDAIGPDTQDLSGAQMPLVAKWSGNAALNYDFTLPFWSGSPFARLDYTYQDRIYWEAGVPNSASDAVGIWGLTLGLRSLDERFEVLGYVKNLTDEFVVNGLSGGLGTVTADLLPEYQRTWGITINYRIH